MIDQEIHQSTAHCEHCAHLEGELRLLMDELAQTREDLRRASQRAAEASRAQAA